MTASITTRDLPELHLHISLKVKSEYKTHCFLALDRVEIDRLFLTLMVEYKCTCIIPLGGGCEWNYACFFCSCSWMGTDWMETDRNLVDMNTTALVAPNELI